MFTLPTPHVWRMAISHACVGLLSCCLVCSSAAVLRADAAAAVVTEDSSVIKTVQQFWNLNTAQKIRTVEMRLECTVTYFDPAWRILFVQDTEGKSAYVDFGGNVFSFRCGQRIVATGKLLIPQGNLSFADATIVEQEMVSPEATHIEGTVGDAEKFGGRFISIDGFVINVQRFESRHAFVTLLAGALPINVWMLLDPTQPMMDIEDATVRVSGVLNPKRDGEGRVALLEVLVSGPEHLAVLRQLKNDSRFEVPVTPIGTLSRLSPDKMVRIAGVVRAQEPGRFVRIRDDSGQIDILTSQQRPFPIGECVEAVGYPMINGVDWRLGQSFVRISQETKTDRDLGRPKPLRLAGQVLELSSEEAVEARPVHLTGVVTWSDISAPFFYVHDSSGGVCVMRGKSESAICPVGSSVELHGVSGAGRFAPLVIAQRFERTGDLVLPAAKPISLEHALTGVEEAQWVELGGYVRRIETREGRNELEVVTSSGDFTAIIPGLENLDYLNGSVVRLQGICAANASEQRKLTGITLWVPGSGYAQIEEPAPAIPFAVPIRAMASLGQFQGAQAFSHRVRVSGTVLHQVPGHLVYLQDGNDSLTVYTRGTELLKPGNKIEVVGFLGRTGARLELREAVYRKNAEGDQPVPREMPAGSGPVASEIGQLVQLKGNLIDIANTAEGTRLTLQSRSSVFEAIFPAGLRDGSVASIRSGSYLAITGVYDVKYDESGVPVSAVLHLRTANDIAVLMHSPWLTRRMIMVFAGLLGFGILVAFAWVTALRRRVKVQTAQLREQMNREMRLKEELQRANKLDSLGLLAGGIAHDFNNLLTIMMGNISLAEMDRSISPGSAQSLRSAEHAAERARDLTQQLLTFAKGGAPLRKAVSLPEVVREVTEFALRGSKVRCVFNISGSLWPASVDKGQIAQVVQNIVINATQAMPEAGEIHVGLANERVNDEFVGILAPGRYVKLSIRDHGAGISPENLTKIFDPYFTTKKRGNGLGLATVHSIVKKHQGHITADSIVGRGTTFSIWLPAAEELTITKAPALSMAPFEAEPFGKHNSRISILFMDDELDVRRMAHSLIQKVGHQVTTVPDGEAAVKEYMRAFREGERYDVVILDLTIPGGMGGRDAIERLLEFDPEVKAIVSSGYSNDAVLADHLAFGFSGIVSKPYDIKDLAAEIDRVANLTPA